MGKVDELEGSWFLPDRSIENEKQDRFAHSTVAAVLDQAIRDAHAPASIGLLGGFGTGKTSIAKLTAARFIGDPNFDLVHVSADKHSGQARSRNIVHAVAGELGGLKGISDSDVTNTLRPLSASISVSGVEPDSTPFVELLLGRRSGKGLALLLLAALVGVGLFVWMSVAVDGQALRQVLTVAAFLPVIGVLMALFWDANDSVIRSWFRAATRQESVPRAEAADEVERVFADLIMLHSDKRSDRRLVVIVDDVDRLGAGDVLDALRAIKSLQAVPKGHEPVFVISCDERIVLDALASATHTTSTAESIDQQAGLAAAAANGGSGAAANAFLEKLFTARIPVPRHIPADMRAFASAVIPEHHPIRVELADDFETVLLVLARGDVSDPRHMIRRINCFLAWYRLGQKRELLSEPWLHLGDVTGRPRMLARLAVLSTDHPKFFDRLVEEEGLLRSCDRLLLNAPLSEVDEELLERSLVAGRTGEDADLVWASDKNLRMFLIGTARHVQDDDRSLVPIIYLSDTEGGRLLGNSRIQAILEAARAGDAVAVAEAVGELKEQEQRAVASALVDLVRDAHEVELPDVLAGVLPSFELLGSASSDLVDTAAYATQRCDMSELEPGLLVELLVRSADRHQDSLLRGLADTGEDADVAVADRRMLEAATYLGSHGGAAHLPDAISEHLETLDEHGGWEEYGRNWLAVAVELERDHWSEIVDRSILPCLLRLARKDESYDHVVDGEPLVGLIAAAAEDTRVQLRSLLASLGVSTVSLQTLLVEGSEVVGVRTAGSIMSMSIAASNEALAADTRRAAIELVAGNVSVWKDAKLAKKDKDDDTEEARPVALWVDDHLIDSLASGDQNAALAVCTHIDQLATIQATLDRLAAEAGRQVVDHPDNDPLPSKTITLASCVLGHLDGLSDADAFVDQLMSSLAQPSGRTSKSDSSLTFVPMLAEAPDGEAQLSRIAGSWTSVIASNSKPFDREIQREAFLRFESSSPAAAQTALSPARSALQQRLATVAGADMEATLELLCALPWSDADAGAVLGVVEPHFASMNSAGFEFDLASRAVSAGHSLTDGWSDRIVSLVEASPTGHKTGLVAEVWGELGPTRQARVLAAACGKSARIDELCAGLDAELLAGLLLTLVQAGDVAHVVGSATTESLALAAPVVARRLTDEGVVLPVERLEPLFTGRDPSALSAVAEEATSELSGTASETESAVSILLASSADLSGPVADRLDTVAIAYLNGGGSADVSRGLGSLLSGSARSGDLKDALRDAKKSDDRRAAALAFEEGAKLRNRSR